MSLPIFIIGCGARKKTVASAAAELYVGPLFTAALKYARSKSDDANIRVLSAKHGLLTLATVIEPYDLTWGVGASISTAELAAQLPAQWCSSAFVLLCGERYRMAIGYAYNSAFKQPMQAKIPLAHLGIGKQLQWLKQQT